MSVVKRKHSTISIKDKYDILMKLRQGISGKALAQEYKIGTSTISDIKKKSDKILSFVAANGEKVDKVRTLRHQEFPEMEQALSKWFFQQKQQNRTITESLLTSKARELYHEMYGNERNFLASRSWLWKFRKRFNINNLNFNRDKSPCTLTTYRASSPMLMHNFLDVQIIHDDEKQENNQEEVKEEHDKVEAQKDVKFNQNNNKIQHNLAFMSLSVAAEWALQNNANASDIQALLRLKTQALMSMQKEII